MRFEDLCIVPEEMITAKDKNLAANVRQTSVSNAATLFEHTSSGPLGVEHSSSTRPRRGFKGGGGSSGGKLNADGPLMKAAGAASAAVALKKSAKKVRYATHPGAERATEHAANASGSNIIAGLVEAAARRSGRRTESIKLETDSVEIIHEEDEEFSSAGRF